MMRIGVEGGNSTTSGEGQAGGDSGQQKHGSMEKLLVNGYSFLHWVEPHSSGSNWYTKL